MHRFIIKSNCQYHTFCALISHKSIKFLLSLYPKTDYYGIQSKTRLRIPSGIEAILRHLNFGLFKI